MNSLLHSSPWLSPLVSLCPQLLHVNLFPSMFLSVSFLVSHCLHLSLTQTHVMSFAASFINLIWEFGICFNSTACTSRIALLCTHSINSNFFRSLEFFLLSYSFWIAVAPSALAEFTVWRDKFSLVFTLRRRRSAEGSRAWRAVWKSSQIQTCPTTNDMDGTSFHTELDFVPRWLHFLSAVTKHRCGYANGILPCTFLCKP